MALFLAMGLTVSAGLAEVARLFGLRDLLVPVLERNAKALKRTFPAAEPGDAAGGQDSTGVRPLDPELLCELVDGTDPFVLQGLRSEVHAATPKLVLLGHRVKRARGRILPVPTKTANLVRPELPGEIGARFKRERERLKITHAALERKTGVNRFSIGRFEGGTRGMESDALLGILYALAEAGGRLDFIVLGRSGAAQVALTESSAETLAALVAEKLSAEPKKTRKALRQI